MYKKKVDSNSMVVGFIFKSIRHPSTRILSEERSNKSNIMKLLRMAMEIQHWDGPAGGQDDVDEAVNVRFVEDTQIGIDCDCYLYLHWDSMSLRVAS